MDSIIGISNFNFNSMHGDFPVHFLLPKTLLLSMARYAPEPSPTILAHLVRGFSPNTPANIACPAKVRTNSHFTDKNGDTLPFYLQKSGHFSYSHHGLLYGTDKNKDTLAFYIQ